MGREFIELFNDWARSYDQTVNGDDPQYRAVFDRYDIILDEVTNHAKGNVLEFGVGTGNLSKRLLKNGHHVTGVEPSEAMRHAATTKYPELTVFDGDFLSYPTLNEPIMTIVSSYAFHHLTDKEKYQAIARFSELLPHDGRIVFADTVYENEASKQEIFKRAEENKFHDLLKDLETEYYPMLDDLKQMFEENGFRVKFRQLNEFVWLIVAQKQKS